jgi:hypothetical protein
MHHVEHTAQVPAMRASLTSTPSLVTQVTLRVPLHMLMSNTSTVDASNLPT